MSRYTATAPNGTPVEVVTIREATDWCGAAAEVIVHMNGDLDRRVTVYGEDIRFGGTLQAPQVNWSAIGSVSLDDARAYADAILFAADLAETLPGPTPKERV